MASTSEESNQAENLQPKTNNRQRFKPQLSCTFCRSRKLKCDRAMPCENCVKRNLASSCTYVHAALARDKPQVQKSSQAPTRDVQSQVRRLEELVISLMHKTNNDGLSSVAQGQVTPDHSQSSSDQLADSIEDDDQGSNDSSRQLKNTALYLGKITIDDDDRANYVGSAHWTAILDNIAGLKDQLDISGDPKEEKENLTEVPGPDILVGSVKAASRAEIMASLPPKAIADKLIARYFQTGDMGSSLIHGPTFMKEYENFWRSPKKALIMWIAQMYAIFALSVFYEVMTKSPSSLDGLPFQDPSDAIAIYREKTIQCLVLGNYTEPGPYTIEALLLHYICAQFQSRDTLFGGWMIFALVIRTAMRLGYHRDASHYPNLSVFRGEMRRRLWTSIVHLDLITSLQVGLPRMIREGMYDTQPPRNLMDEDFSENTKVLPLPRPDHELTTVGCINIKHRITKVLGMAVDQANWICPISYAAVMKLDKQLHDVYLKTPPSLIVINMSDFLNGSPIQMIRKATLQLTFQKARCILHRKFFFPSKTTGEYPYPYSMKSCIDSSMRILQMQLLMHEECQPGKPLYEHRWRTSSLLSQDFLLAGMMVCMYIGHGITNNSGDQENSQSSGNLVRWTQTEMLQALQASCRIWEDVASRSKEAAKAVKTLKSMLARVAVSHQSSPADAGRSSQSWADFAAEAAMIGSDDVRFTFKGTAAESVLSSSWLPVTAPIVKVPLPMGCDIQPSFDNIIGSMGSETMDWELWDSQVYNTGLSDAPNDLWTFDSNTNPGDPAFNTPTWDQ